MVSPVLVQAAAVAKLLADTALIAVTTDIREANAQLDDFAYPNVRVKLMSQAPVTNGNCHTRLSDLVLEILSFSETPSSQECQNVLFLAHQALFGQLLTDTTWRSVRLDSEGGPEGPVRVSPRVWRARAALFARLYEIG
jgi:hypothetical protein